MAEWREGDRFTFTSEGVVTNAYLSGHIDIQFDDLAFENGFSGGDLEKKATKIVEPFGRGDILKNRDGYVYVVNHPNSWGRYEGYTKIGHIDI